jgi:aminopeptidase N
MTVDSVSTHTFQRTTGALALPAPAHGTVHIWYHGAPSNRAIAFTDHAGVTRVASYGLPNSAREWWPTLDDPSEKADSADIQVTAPAALQVASNGRLVARVPHDDGTATTHWSVRYPIYSDVISIAAADYVVRQADFHSHLSTAVPLTFFVFPEDSTRADSDFTVVPRAMAFMESILGPYPFGREKYGIAEFARKSFREHQTLPSYGAAFITGKHENDQIIAHEIAHQWFGNSVTVARWGDIWLNESFAEYMAWRWIRADRGDSAFARLVNEARGKVYRGSLAHADSGGFATMFGDLTFEKGPLVLVSLEALIGTRAMDAALADYVRTHAYGLASQQDFVAACERQYHHPLAAIVDEWVRRSDNP